MKFKVTLTTNELRLQGKELVHEFETHKEAYKCFNALVDDNKKNASINYPVICLWEGDRLLWAWLGHKLDIE